MSITIKKSNQRSTYFINRANERFESLPHPATLFTDWLAYTNGKYVINRTTNAPTITIKRKPKEWNRVEYELDLLQAHADHFRDLDFTTRYERAYM